MKQRIFSLFTALCLCLTLLPTVAFAEEEGTTTTTTNKTLMLGSTVLEGTQKSNVYYGIYKQSSDGNNGFNIDPIKWRVLSNADGKLFLLADQNLDVKPYNSSYTSITWEKSTIRSWLNGYKASENNSGTDYSSDNFMDTAFSSGEQGAIAETYVYNATQSDGSSNPNPSYGTSGGEDTTDKIFLLSIEEANNSSYFPNGNDSRKSTNTAYVASYSNMYGAGEADYGWLRSPGDDKRAAHVEASGGVNIKGYEVVFTHYTVRPAFNLNLNSVLFTSAAEGGKSPAAASGGNQGGEDADAIFKIGDYDGSEWKLTLLDTSRSFSVTETTATSASGGTVTLNYTGATVYNADTAPQRIYFCHHCGQ